MLFLVLPPLIKTGEFLAIPTLTIPLHFSVDKPGGRLRDVRADICRLLGPEQRAAIP